MTRLIEKTFLFHLQELDTVVVDGLSCVPQGERRTVRIDNLGRKYIECGCRKKQHKLMDLKTSEGHLAHVRKVTATSIWGKHVRAARKAKPT